MSGVRVVAGPGVIRARPVSRAPCARIGSARVFPDLDLGAAPGSWSQYVSEQMGAQGKVIAIDILPIKPIDNVLFLKGDFTEQTIYDQCLKLLQGRNVDLVISDMAPNLSGIKSRDQARSMMLAELTSEFE